MITTSADSARSVFAIDMDGDGDTDVLSASLNDDTVAWYENLDGSGGSFSTHVITASADYARSVFAIDMDGDGDVDVLSASGLDDTVAWYVHINAQTHRLAHDKTPSRHLRYESDAGPFPSPAPTAQPTTLPTPQPSSAPSSQPSPMPTLQPSSLPSPHPASLPSPQPTVMPSSEPSTSPTPAPSWAPPTTAFAVSSTNEKGISQTAKIVVTGTGVILGLAFVSVLAMEIVRRMRKKQKLRRQMEEFGIQVQMSPLPEAANQVASVSCGKGCHFALSAHTRRKGLRDYSLQWRDL